MVSFIGSSVKTCMVRYLSTNAVMPFLLSQRAISYPSFSISNHMPGTTGANNQRRSVGD